MDNKIVHQKLLQILKNIDLICQIENISYMIQSGTLLGAVREKGFIKWDTDADIMMHRSDFDKFENNFSKYLIDSEFCFDYSDRVPKVCCKDNPSIHVDIFIIDTLPNNIVIQKMKVLALKVLQGMMKKNIDYKTYKLTGKLLISVTSLLGFLINDKTKLKLYKKISKNEKGGKSSFIFISNELYRFMDLRLDKNILEMTTKLQFEDTELIAPLEWDYFLKIYYGEDYMIPKRKNYFV
jgi:lipopolysaccharide cholinephosphotransferase